jgi:hypothetical protein
MLIYLLFLASFLYLRVLKPCKYAGGKSRKITRIIPPYAGGFY